MTRTMRSTTWAAAAVTAVLLGGFTASPALARPLGPYDTPSVRAVGGTTTLGAPECPLRRVERQLVRCDNLTGAGAVAPSWVRPY